MNDKRYMKPELPIEELCEYDLSVRTFNCLKAGGVDTIGRLMSMSDEELSRLRNFGKRSIEEISVLRTLITTQRYSDYLFNKLGYVREENESSDYPVMYCHQTADAKIVFCENDQVKSSILEAGEWKHFDMSFDEITACAQFIHEMEAEHVKK